MSNATTKGNLEDGGKWVRIFSAKILKFRILYSTSFSQIECRILIDAIFGIDIRIVRKNEACLDVVNPFTSIKYTSVSIKMPKYHI